MEDLVGQNLSKYRIDTKLAKGGMGTVYLAHDTVLERDVAIKVLVPALAADERFVKRFQLEAKTLARLNHPGIVPVYDASWEGHRLYIVMEYVEGGSLADAIADEGQLPPAKVVELLKSVAAGLDYAHGFGLIHRDIKPANILLNQVGEAKITDFGLVKDETYGLSLTSERFGTPAYMAPEQIEGEPVLPETDVYALGIVAYEMLTGQAPFKGTISSIIEGHLLREPPAPRDANPMISLATQRALLKALAKKPDDRYPTATAFVQKLQETLEKRDTRVAPAKAIPPPKTERPPLAAEPVSRDVSRPISGSTPIPGSGQVAAPSKSQGGLFSRLSVRTIGIVGGLGLLLVCICGGGLLLYANLPTADTPPDDTPTFAPALATPTSPPVVPTPIEDTEILFADDFSDSSGPWESLDEDDAYLDYEQGGFRILVYKEDWYFWTTPGLTLSNVSIEVDVTKLGGPDVNEFGVICRLRDNENFYFFTLGNDGFFSVGKFEDGEISFFNPDEQQFSEAILQGAVTNHLRAECEDDALRFYANGSLIFEDFDSSFSSGDIGLIAGTFDVGGTDVFFDNLVVRTP